MIKCCTTLYILTYFSKIIEIGAFWILNSFIHFSILASEIEIQFHKENVKHVENYVVIYDLYVKPISDEFIINININHSLLIINKSFVQNMYTLCRIFLKKTIT